MTLAYGEGVSGSKDTPASPDLSWSEMNWFNPDGTIGETGTCQQCGEVFAAESTFFLHLAGSSQLTGWKCLPPATLLAQGWQRDSRGKWRRPPPPQGAFSKRAEGVPRNERRPEAI